MMKLNELLQCMCAMTLRIYDAKEQREIFKGHIREIRDTGFKKDYEVTSMFRGNDTEDVDIFVREAPEYD